MTKQDRWEKWAKEHPNHYLFKKSPTELRRERIQRVRSAYPIGYRHVTPILHQIRTRGVKWGKRVHPKITNRAVRYNLL